MIRVAAVAIWIANVVPLSAMMLGGSMRISDTGSVEWRSAMPIVRGEGWESAWTALLIQLWQLCPYVMSPHILGPLDWSRRTW